jgi:short chain dehydrogenase
METTTTTSTNHDDHDHDHENEMDDMVRELQQTTLHDPNDINTSSPTSSDRSNKRYSEKWNPNDTLGMSTHFDWNPPPSSPTKSSTSSATSNSSNIMAGITKMTIEPKSMMETDQRFVGKTIVITGAGGQLGRAGCFYFAQRGAKIAALDRSKDALKETFECINIERVRLMTVNNKNMNPNLLHFDFKPYVCDVTNPEQMKDVIESIVHRYQHIHYVWNNAGYH